MVLETWGTVPLQVPKKKLKSKQNQKSYQHFYHFTIPPVIAEYIGKSLIPKFEIQKFKNS